MKTLLLIFIFALSLKADTIYQGKCVSSFFYNYTSLQLIINSSSGIVFKTTPDTAVIDSLTNNLNKFEYVIINGSYQCRPIPKNNTLGLSEEQFNISMAFYGIFLSSLIAFGLLKAF